VKRLFRSRFAVELSETALGHSQVSELLQDERFADICRVKLEVQGYIVVQHCGSSSVASLCPPTPLKTYSDTVKELDEQNMPMMIQIPKVECSLSFLRNLTPSSLQRWCWAVLLLR
jgi:hypothetical protein